MSKIKNAGLDKYGKVWSLNEIGGKRVNYIMAVLYITRGKPSCFTAVLYSFFQTLISEVTERIPFILSHSIRSGCNLIMHPKRL